MKKQRLSSKLLAFLMAMLILLVSLPTYAFASLIDYSSDENEADAVEGVENEASFAKSEVYVLSEDEALRTENTKHFKLSDGTVKAVSYAQPVHYMDEDGNWIDIDNALTLNGNEYSVNNKQEIKFANKSGSTGLISIKDGEYKIDFTPLNTNKVSVEIENPQENNSRKFDDVKKLNNLVSYATYKNIYDGVDLEYILVGNSIKENIIVNEKQESYVFSFEIKLNKLNAELVNNAIILTDYDTGEQVYEIPAPYMLDANGEYSSDVEYTLTKNSKWKYTLTVTASTEWINDAEREFPVKIDPTVTVSFADYDTFVMDGGAYEDYDSLIIGNFFSYYDAAGFFKFNNTPKIPKQSILVDAKIVFMVSYYYNSSDVDMVLGAYDVKKPWTVEGEDKDVVDSDFWQEFSSEDYVGLEVDSKSINNTGFFELEITSLYQKWANNNGDNNGVCIKAKNLPQSSDANIRITTRNHTGIEAPSIVLTYYDAIGVEDYYAYVENTLGDVGKSYVNLYNGSLTYINKLTSIEIGENLTYDINMVYNSIENRWTPSFKESITKVEYNAYENKPNNDMRDDVYYWQDADGTSHAFTIYMQKNGYGENVPYNIVNGNATPTWNPENVFYPHDDIDYVLIKTENNEYILRDYDGNQKMFDADGRLSKICDAQGNTIYFYYIKQSDNENQSPRLSSIVHKSTNGIITEQIRLNYDTDNDLRYIYNIQTRVETTINWLPNWQVGSVIYNYENQDANKTIQFAYYSNSALLYLMADNSIGKKLDYTKNENNEYFKLEIQINNETEKQYLIQYNDNESVITDGGTNFNSETDNFTIATYTFDNRGRKIVTDQTYDDELVPETIYYTIAYSTNVYKEPYISAEAAAIAFSQRYYSSSYYIRHEYGALIYSVTQNNVTTYNYTNIVYGGVHNVSISLEMSIGGIYVGDIHTHPFDVNFSDDDKDYNVGCGYLVIPTLEIKIFNYATQAEYDTTISFSPVDLTNQERELLRERFENSWQAHVSYDCTAESNCEEHADEWPRENLLP